MSNGRILSLNDPNTERTSSVTQSQNFSLYTCSKVRTRFLFGDSDFISTKFFDIELKTVKPFPAAVYRYSVFRLKSSPVRNLDDSNSTAAGLCSARRNQFPCE